MHSAILRARQSQDGLLRGKAAVTTGVPSPTALAEMELDTHGLRLAKSLYEQLAASGREDDGT